MDEDLINSGFTALEVQILITFYLPVELNDHGLKCVSRYKNSCNCVEKIIDDLQLRTLLVAEDVEISFEMQMQQFGKFLHTVAVVLTSIALWSSYAQYLQQSVATDIRPTSPSLMWWSVISSNASSSSTLLIQQMEYVSLSLTNIVVCEFTSKHIPCR